MKSLKYILIASLLTITAFAAAVYTSCKKDKCKGISCLNGGACNEGKCVCPAGYGGANCETNPDPCLNVVCLNGGTCSNGKCTCPTGVGGTHCDTIYRNSYTHAYLGDGTDNAMPANIYTNWRLTFSSVGTDLTKMQLFVQDDTWAPILTLPITLSSFSTTGSSYSITPTVNGGNSYTGSGTVNATTSSLSLTETSLSSSVVTVYTFANMTKL